MTDANDCLPQGRRKGPCKVAARPLRGLAASIVRARLSSLHAARVRGLGPALVVACVLVLLSLVLAGCSGDDQAVAKGAEAPATPAGDPSPEPGGSVGPAGVPANSPPPTHAGSQAQTFRAKSAARTVTLTGFTRARTSYALVSEEEGRCAEVLADIGDVIGEDGVFARLDTTFILLDVESNRADQARLGGEVSFHTKEMERYEDLVRRDTAAQSTLDAHVRDRQTAVQQLRALQVAGRRLAERLERHTLSAPPGWRVKSRNVEQGEWITKGQTVAEVANYQVLLVPYALSLTELDGLQSVEGGPVLRLPELGKEARASILRVAPGFDPETRKINVDLVIEQGDFDFRGGIRTELTVGLPDPGGAVTVPESALVRAYEDYFLVRPGGVRVKVLLLGSAPEGGRRVSSDEVAPGDEFLVSPLGE